MSISLWCAISSDLVTVTCWEISLSCYHLHVQSRRTRSRPGVFGWMRSTPHIASKDTTLLQLTVAQRCKLPLVLAMFQVCQEWVTSDISSLLWAQFRKLAARLSDCQRGHLKACVGAFKLLENSSRCLFKAWRTADKPGDLLTWRTDKTFLCSIGSDAFFCNPKRRSWVFVMAAKLSATLSPPTRRNAALLSLQHPCRCPSRPWSPTHLEFHRLHSPLSTRYGC